MDAPGFERSSSDEARRNVHRLIEHNRRRCEVLLRAAGRPPVASVGIVGAGMMGASIAAASLAGGLAVVLHDADPAARARAGEMVLAELVASIGMPSSEAAEHVADRLRVTGEFDAVAACPLVLESVPESTDAKHRVYAALEPLVADDGVLATNTSTIPIDRLASGLTRPERFCGIHFFHPVARRPLVEIVRGAKTSAATLATAVGYARAIDKMVLFVDDGPGFVVNRLLLPYLTEAVELLADGVPIERVEAVATTFGMAKGPLALVDEIGLDTVMAGGRVLWEAFPRRVVISPLLVTMYKAGRFGVKSGAGFFNYAAADGQKDRVPGPKRSGGPDAPRPSPPVDPVALEKIAEWARRPRVLGDDDVRDRLLLSMVVEATRLLEEGRVAGPRDVDLGMLFGLGFPAARGGLLWWVDTLGPAELAARLARLESLGPRGEPTALLCQMAAEGRRFYDLTRPVTPLAGQPVWPGDVALPTAWDNPPSGAETIAGP